jgi:riboflavin biosynthesis pyrimidine reductase
MYAGAAAIQPNAQPEPEPSSSQNRPVTARPTILATPVTDEAPLTPLEVLFEEPDLPAVELPAELRRLHGSDLGLGDACVYANFVSTVDGVVAIPSIPRSNDLVAAGSLADRFLIALLRAFADVVLVGAGTLGASPRGTWRAEKVYPAAAVELAELRRRLGRAETPLVAIVTGRGSIDVAHPVLETGALVLTSDDGAARLAGRLPGASELVTLGSGPELDLSLAIRELRGRGHAFVLSEAGPHTLGGLLSAGVVDELFLTVSPLLVGDDGPGSRFRLVESADLLPPVRGRLRSVRRHEHHLFLRYRVGQPERA